MAVAHVAATNAALLALVCCAAWPCAALFRGAGNSRPTGDLTLARTTAAREPGTGAVCVLHATSAVVAHCRHPWRQRRRQRRLSPSSTSQQAASVNEKQRTACTWVSKIPSRPEGQLERS